MWAWPNLKSYWQETVGRADSCRGERNNVPAIEKARDKLLEVGHS